MDIAIKTAVLVGTSGVSLVLVVSLPGFVQVSSKDRRQGGTCVSVVALSMNDVHNNFVDFLWMNGIHRLINCMYCLSMALIG